MNIVRHSNKKGFNGRENLHLGTVLRLSLKELFTEGGDADYAVYGQPFA